MIFLNHLYNLPNSTSGIDQIVKDTATTIPGLVPLLLVFLWFVVFLGGIIRQNMRNGTSDYPAWSVTASLVTFLAVLILSVSSGFIHLDWLVIVTVITIFSFVWLALDKRGNDV